jgi:hypothetical protein
MQVVLNIEILPMNHRTFELPTGFSARLHARLEQEIRDGGAPSDAHSPAMSTSDGNTGYLLSCSRSRQASANRTSGAVPRDAEEALSGRDCKAHLGLVFDDSPQHAGPHRCFNSDRTAICKDGIAFTNRSGGARTDNRVNRDLYSHRKCTVLSGKLAVELALSISRSFR